LTFLLFSTSLIALVQQQLQVAELSATNLKASTERLAIEMEEQVSRLAVKCLNDGLVVRLLNDPTVGTTPDESHRLRQDLLEARKRYVFARHFVVTRGKQVLFPRLDPWPLLRQSSSKPPKQARGSSLDFWLLLDRGDAQYVQLRYDQALTYFKRAEALPVGGQLKALALARIGRIYLGSNRLTEAAQTYRELLSRFGDEYSEEGVPYSLNLVHLPAQLVGRIYPDYRQRLQAVYKDLTQGRWEMSGKQLDFYLSELERRLSLKPEERPATDFLDHFKLARALGDELEAQKISGFEEIVPRTTRYDTDLYQTFWNASSKGKGTPEAVGFSLDLSWLSGLVASRRSTGGQGAAIELVVQPAPNYSDTVVSAQAAGTSILVPFGTRLSGLALSVPVGVIRAGRLALYRELVFLGMSIAMFLSIMGLGVYLLVRVARDLHYLDLRNDFVNAVSHEFKTPLSLIRLYSETLADGDEDFSAEERRNCIQIIARESQRLGQLIDNVLDYANIERGQRAQELKVGNLQTQVLETVGDYSRYLSQQGFTIETDVEPSLPSVRFDRSEVAQVVLNLLDNARKYSGQSKVIHVRMRKQDEEVVLEVEDHGPGIPADEQKRIFDPFYQIADGRKKSGSGLGLYLVRHVMDGLGGRIEVESEVGRGTKFKLFFLTLEAAGGDASQPEGHEALESGWRD
jgi:signal transduction histidine kinase